MYYNCSKLSSMPDISKWDTSNVNNMFSVFDNCSELSSLPDISKWNTSKVKDMIFILSSCKSGYNISSKFNN